MTNPEVAILMLALFIVMVLLGFPVAFTLLAMGVGFGYYAYYEAGSIETIADVFNNKIFYLLNQNTYSVMENDTLVAIPLFLFMGYVVERANIVNKLFYSLQMAARNMPGSMAIAALITCAVFSTASGIVGAVVTLMGLADRLCGNCGTFSSAPLRRRHYPRVSFGRIVHYLRHYPGHDKSVDCAEAARRGYSAQAHYLLATSDLLRSVDGLDYVGARIHSGRSCDAGGSCGHGCVWRARIGGAVWFFQLGDA